MINRYSPVKTQTTVTTLADIAKAETVFNSDFVFEASKQVDGFSLISDKDTDFTDAYKAICDMRKTLQAAKVTAIVLTPSTFTDGTPTTSATIQTEKGNIFARVWGLKGVALNKTIKGDELKKVSFHYAKSGKNLVTKCITDATTGKLSNIPVLYVQI